MTPDLYPRTEIMKLLRAFYWWSRLPGNPSADEHERKVRDTMDAILDAIQRHQDAAGWRIARDDDDGARLGPDAV